MVMQRDLSIALDTRAFSREVTSIDHPVLSTVKQPRGADVQGLFTGTTGVKVDAGGWIGSFPTRSGRVPRMDRKPGVLQAEALRRAGRRADFLSGGAS